MEHWRQRGKDSRSCNKTMKFLRSRIKSWMFYLLCIGLVYERIQLTVERIRCENNQRDEGKSMEQRLLSAGGDNQLVQYGDSVYIRSEWDRSPIIIEEYKLVFFTVPKVACTVWKQLFRRIAGYTDDWNVMGTELGLPHNPAWNGLKYLYHYDRSTASKMLQDPTWTKAIFVRDPKERFVSAYLDKVINHDYIIIACCKHSKDCLEPARQSIETFLNIIHYCYDPHWRPITKRIVEDKYWPYINFVGHMETIKDDAERLLRRIGAWDEYGASGWGDNGTQTIFQTQSSGITHITNATNKLQSIITKNLETKLDLFYAADYTNPYLNITKRKVF